MNGFKVSPNSGWNPAPYTGPYRNFASVDEQLTGRCSQRRKVGNNTYLERRGQDAIAVKLHRTDVVTFYRDGRVQLNTGGWQTVTTKDRFNTFSPIRVYADKGVWYASDGERTVVYEDGLTTDVTGHLPEGGPSPDELRKLRKCVVKFTKTFVEKFKRGEIEKPGPGDCWFCSMFDRAGDMRTVNDHLLHHIGYASDEYGQTETYYVPSLLYNACVEGKGTTLSRAAESTVYNWLNDLPIEGWALDHSLRCIERTLKNYLLKRVGLPTR
jgi:hypothetical protein